MSRHRVTSASCPLFPNLHQRGVHARFVPKADLSGRRNPVSCDFRSRNGQYRGLRAEVTVFIGTFVAQLSLAE
jgi:hypothetical protein